MPSGEAASSVGIVAVATTARCHFCNDLYQKVGMKEGGRQGDRKWRCKACTSIDTVLPSLDGGGWVVAGCGWWWLMVACGGGWWWWLVVASGGGVEGRVCWW